MPPQIQTQIQELNNDVNHQEDRIARLESENDRFLKVLRPVLRVIADCKDQSIIQLLENAEEIIKAMDEAGVVRKILPLNIESDTFSHIKTVLQQAMDQGSVPFPATLNIYTLKSFQHPHWVVLMLLAHSTLMENALDWKYVNQTRPDRHSQIHRVHVEQNPTISVESLKGLASTLADVSFALTKEKLSMGSDLEQVMIFRNRHEPILKNLVDCCKNLQQELVTQEVGAELGKVATAHGLRAAVGDTNVITTAARIPSEVAQQYVDSDQGGGVSSMLQSHLHAKGLAVVKISTLQKKNSRLNHSLQPQETEDSGPANKRRRTELSKGERRRLLQKKKEEAKKAGTNG